MAEEKKTASRRSRRSSSKTETPKSEAPKVEQAQAPKATEAKKVESSKQSKEIKVGSEVTTPSGKVCKVLEIKEDLCYLERIDNKRNLYLNKNKLTLK